MELLFAKCPCTDLDVNAEDADATANARKSSGRHRTILSHR